jgi:hypothetical protein
VKYDWQGLEAPWRPRHPLRYRRVLPHGQGGDPPAHLPEHEGLARLLSFLSHSVVDPDPHGSASAWIPWIGSNFFLKIILSFVKFEITKKVGKILFPLICCCCRIRDPG